MLSPVVNKKIKFLGETDDMKGVQSMSEHNLFLENELQNNPDALTPCRYSLCAADTMLL